MTTNDDLTAAMIKTNGEMIAEAIARRIATTPTFDMTGITPDRSKNGRRIPRSVKHRAYR